MTRMTAQPIGAAAPANESGQDSYVLLPSSTAFGFTLSCVLVKKFERSSTSADVQVKPHETDPLPADGLKEFTNDSTWQ